MYRHRFSPIATPSTPNKRVILYDSGFPHLILRWVAFVLASWAFILLLDIVASFFNWFLLNHNAPLGTIVTFLATGILSWWCAMYGFARLVIYLDSDANQLLLYGPSYHFQMKELSSVTSSKIAAIAIQYHHSPGPGGREDWSVDWIDNQGDRHELACLPSEEEAQTIAHRIGQAILKPIA